MKLQVLFNRLKMKKLIRLNNGTNVAFFVIENETHNFFICENHAQAKELEATFIGIGKYCEVSYLCGVWYVKTSK